MRLIVAALVLVLGFGALGVAAAIEGDPEEGAHVFRACLACHSLMPGQHRTGPSLAGVVGHKAGTALGFNRYSTALKGSGVTWTVTALDAWLADPQRFLPGNRMTFPGIQDPQARADLIAYLERAADGEGGPAQERSQQGAMGGMMGGPELLDLRRAAGPNNQVTAIRHCGDTYTVDVATGESHPFWEFNLRFKTDSSANGPEPGHPVLIPASMMGDRAFVIFAIPSEISPFIENAC